MMLKEKNTSTRKDFVATLKKELKQYKNTLVLSDFSVAQLVNLSLAHKEDYYWAFRQSNGVVFLSSVSLGFTSLKGELSEKDYKYLKRLWDTSVGKR